MNCTHSHEHSDGSLGHETVSIQQETDRSKLLTTHTRASSGCSPAAWGMYCSRAYADQWSPQLAAVLPDARWTPSATTTFTSKSPEGPCTYPEVPSAAAYPITPLVVPSTVKVVLWTIWLEGMLVFTDMEGKALMVVSWVVYVGYGSFAVEEQLLLADCALFKLLQLSKKYSTGHPTSRVGSQLASIMVKA